MQELGILVLMKTGLMLLLLVIKTEGNDDAKRLYHDLLIQNKYNKLIRPVGNNTDRPLTVKMGIRLSQLIDVVSNILFVSFYFYMHYYRNNFPYP